MRAESRADGGAGVPQGVEIVAADVTDRDDATRAFQDAETVYHCAGAPYHRWPELHPHR